PVRQHEPACLVVGVVLDVRQQGHQLRSRGLGRGDCLPSHLSLPRDGGAAAGFTHQGRRLWWPCRLTNWIARSLPSLSVQLTVVTRLTRCVSAPRSLVTTLTTTCCPVVPIGNPSRVSSCVGRRSFDPR